MTRQRLLDIFLTALMGAGIAFLQALLSGLLGDAIPAADPALAGAAGAGLRAIWPHAKVTA